MMSQSMDLLEQKNMEFSSIFWSTCPLNSGSILEHLL